jgi:5-methylcytosine-specific restriction endonuclease McrA
MPMAKAAKYKYQIDSQHYSKMKEYRNDRRRVIAIQISEYKASKCCSLCVESSPECLEFHHIDPRTKDHEPTRLARDKGWSFEKVIAHLETTCIILCANCHRKVHKKLREKQHKPPARKTRRET